jgi:hypothetical protein
VDIFFSFRQPKTHLIQTSASFNPVIFDFEAIKLHWENFEVLVGWETQLAPVLLGEEDEVFSFESVFGWKGTLTLFQYSYSHFLRRITYFSFRSDLFSRREVLHLPYHPFQSRHPRIHHHY